MNLTVERKEAATEYNQIPRNDKNRRKRVAMKKKIAISTLIMLSFLIMTVIGISPSIAAEKEFLIGSVGCMSGPAAMLGKNLRIGVEFAVEEINKTGGINGMNVRAIFRDDEADPTKSLTLVRELVEKEKIHAFIGPTNTTCAYDLNYYFSDTNNF